MARETFNRLLIVGVLMALAGGILTANPDGISSPQLVMGILLMTTALGIFAYARIKMYRT